MKLRIRDTEPTLGRGKSAIRGQKNSVSPSENKELKTSEIWKSNFEEVSNCTYGLLYVSSFKSVSNVTFVTTARSRSSTAFNNKTGSYEIETHQQPLDLSIPRVNQGRNSPGIIDYLKEEVQVPSPSWTSQISNESDNNLAFSTFESDEETAHTRFVNISDTIEFVYPENSTLTDMLSSRRHRSDETFADRETLAAVGGKSSYPHSAEAWLDSRSSPDGNETNRIVDEDRESNLYSHNAYDEDVNEADDHVTEDTDQDVAFNYSMKDRQSTTDENPDSKLKQAKRERIENVVTSIKDKPSKPMVGKVSDFASNDNGSQTRHVKKRRMGEIGELQKEIEYLGKEPISEEVCDGDIGSYDVDSDEIDQTGDWSPHEKRPRFANNIESPRDAVQDRNYNGFYRGSVNFMLQQNGRRPGESAPAQNMAYQVLVQSIKRELTTALEKVAEKSAQRILEELHKSNANKLADNDQTRITNSGDIADKDHAHRLSSKKLTDSDEIELTGSNKPYNTSRFVVDDKTERVRTSNQSQMCFGDVQVRKKQEGNFRPQKSASKNFTYKKMDSEEWEKGSNGSGSSPETKKTSTGEYDIQTQALALVKKKTSSPNSNKSSPSPDGRPFVIRYPSSRIPSEPSSPHHENHGKNPSRLSRGSISSDPPVRSGVTPPESSSKGKLFHPSLFADSNFYSSAPSAFRLPLRNDAISSSFRREPFTSSNLLKAPPFSFGPSLYPSSAHSQSVFPFSTGQLPFPLFQSFQQNRLANAIADYGRFREGYEHGTSRPVSTRTSTREHPRASGLNRPHHGHKPDASDYRGLTSAEVSPHSIASIQEGLTPQHLKKAKLMFFYTRYPSANTLKTFFNDVKFSRATTSQLIKWFSNFREFYYIQMEKFARQALSDGVTDINQMQVTRDSELFRVLNLHYNKSNDFRVPSEFLAATLRSLQEFFMAIQKGKDHDPSWKKVIYKVICKLDQDIPELFKLPNVLERLDEISN